jgi:hypothetical protein
LCSIIYFSFHFLRRERVAERDLPYLAGHREGFGHTLHRVNVNVL